MAKKKNQESNIIVFHKPGTEWLTRDICDHYCNKAKGISNHSTGDPSFNALFKELKERFDLTEVQAINILNGYHINEYVAFHEKLQQGGAQQYSSNDDNVEYLEWLAEKEEKKKSKLDDYGLLDDD